MRKALIHIGSGKTGTSAIQSALSKMSDPYVSYPMIGSTGHQNLDVIFRTDMNRTSREVRSRFKNDQSGYNNYRSSFKKTLQDCIGSTEGDIIISSELLFNLEKHEVNMLLDFFTQ